MIENAVKITSGQGSSAWNSSSSWDSSFEEPKSEETSENAFAGFAGIFG